MKGSQALGAFYVIIMLLAGGWKSAKTQTIVSTEVQKKRAVLEYFRGIYCVYCPEADYFANELETIYGEAVIPINIFAGDYSYPIDPLALDLRSTFGQDIHDISGLIGYPAGMVNRRNFTGLEQGASGSFAINRNRWSEAVESLIEEDAPVNIGLQAQYDIETREMEILVEVYHTSSISAPSQALHIAIVQDSIRTLQAGSSSGFNYFHSNVLRDIITGETGIALGAKAAGDFFSQRIEYTLPEALFGTQLEASEIHLVAYITEDRKNILNATTHTPVYNAQQAYDINLLSTYRAAEMNCEDWITPTILIRNDGNEVAENIRISYSVNDGSALYLDWPGELKTFEKARIELPEIHFVSAHNIPNQLRVELESSAASVDENLNNNLLVHDFNAAPATEFQQVKLEIATDNFGYETYWDVLNSDGDIVTQGGNLLVGISGGGKQVGAGTNPGVYNNNETIEAIIDLPGPDCYTFRLIDDYGDGFCCGFGEGFFRLRDELGAVLFSGNRFGVTREITFEVQALTTSNDDLQAQEFPFVIYPNPVRSEQLELSFGLSDHQTVHFNLSDANGAALKQGTWSNLGPVQHKKAISLAAIPSGIYFLTLRTADAMQTQKLIRIN
ncbi:MAG: Omp28-related outer membrane protein [Saprospiraceae bacterium]|nr:Omp28-related outer membrane protein [Saprospiraceae bacterium]